MQPRLIHILYLLPPKTRARNRVKVFFLSSDGKHVYREEAGVSGLAIASSQIAPFFPEHHVFGSNVRTSVMLISFEFAQFSFLPTWFRQSAVGNLFCQRQARSLGGADYQTEIQDNASSSLFLFNSLITKERKFTLSEPMKLLHSCPAKIQL